MFDFGMNLAGLRKEAGYTQQQFADALHVSCHTVKFWELNYCSPNFEHLVAIAKLHGVTLDYLVGFDKRRKIVLDSMGDAQKEVLLKIKKECDTPTSAKDAALIRQRRLLLLEELEKLLPSDTR